MTPGLSPCHHIGVSKAGDNSKVYTVHAAKTEFSKILRLVEAGHEITVARGAHPVAKIVPIASPKVPARTFGPLHGLIVSEEPDALEPDNETTELFEATHLQPS